MDHRILGPPPELKHHREWCQQVHECLVYFHLKKKKYETRKSSPLHPTPGSQMLLSREIENHCQVVGHWETMQVTALSLRICLLSPHLSLQPCFRFPQCPPLPSCADTSLCLLNNLRCLDSPFIIVPHTSLVICFVFPFSFSYLTISLEF